ncbi:hypothetical protein CYR32_00275 [Chimaeribacter coloradensis]|uniref:Uncharacterized protein n=1 Tax=Chimaeribacter coloradensis TaxID=2060068 RepID=A0A2N5ECF2_9GAMM|nr:hypothetical protein CYR32_00275 [Chimaeribacter coloradensis]
MNYSVVRQRGPPSAGRGKIGDLPIMAENAGLTNRPGRAVLPRFAGAAEKAGRAAAGQHAENGQFTVIQLTSWR